MSDRAPVDAPLPWVWHEEYGADIGPHVFPTVKYDRVRRTLLEDGTLREEELVVPRPAPWEEIARVHTSEYVRKIRERDFSRAEVLRLELPLTEAFRRASLLCAGGTTTAARIALERGLCLHLGGGFHHAFADHGEGFCLVNDDSVFTFSMHQEANYPFEKPPGDLDVGLPDGIGDDAYLETLAERLPAALEPPPDVAVYLAGADPYREDQLGGLGLSKRGLRRRDDLVLAACRERGVGVAVCLAGGYAVRLADTVAIHAETGRSCAASWRDRGARGPV